MEGILPLAVLLGASGSLLFAAHQKKKHHRHNAESFQDTGLVQPSVKKTLGQQHSQYVEDAARRFNPLMNLINPQQNTLLPPNFTPGNLHTTERDIRDTLRAALATPNNPSFDVTVSKAENILINTGQGATTQADIKRCEAVNTINCDAYNDSKFADSCGICHEDGKNSGGNPVVGGLYITEDNKHDAKVVADRMNSRNPNYVPSVGTCKVGRFSTSKAQCLRIKAQMECEAKQAFDDAGCSQCAQDSTFQYIDSENDRAEPSIVVTGTGNIQVKRLGSANTILQTTLSATPTTVPLPKFQEGDLLEITVTPASGSLAGYLVGNTVSGDFRVDLVRLVQQDTVTNRLPRLAGIQSVGSDNYNVMRPGRGKDSMVLRVLNTFTFLDTREIDAALCASAPFITKQSSAEALESGACFKKGQAPGAYSLDCLQQTFVGAGCTEEGEAYPSNQAKAAALMRRSDGRALAIGEIGGDIYNKSLTAYTGTREDGTKLSITEWDTVSRYCTGRRITSPCDFDNQESGPLSTDCLNYLWTNAGSTTNLPGSPGPTYTNVPRTASLNQQGQLRYCTNSGSMAPTGGAASAAVQTARSKGGVAAVKAFYDDIHRRANDNSLTDAQRQAAIQQCYGVDLITQNQTLSAAVPQSVRDSTCVPQTIIASITNPSGSQSVGQVNVKRNWEYRFTLRPTGVGGNQYAYPCIFYATITGESSLQLGERIPAVYLMPNSTRLHVSISIGYNQWASINTQESLPLNQDTNVSISLRNGIVRVILTGAITGEVTQAIPDSATGLATIYMPNPANPAFKGTLTNLTFCSFDAPYVSVLDNPAGRTQSSFAIVKNYVYNEPNIAAIELGPFGMAPWGRSWAGAGNFPDDGSAKWIWNTANAQQDAAANRQIIFYTTFTNSTQSPMDVIFYIIADDYGSIGLNYDMVARNINGYGSVQMRIPPGENLIRVFVVNGGGPAGFIGICKQGGTTLFRTSSSWRVENK
jgi:hypothetical protein